MADFLLDLQIVPIQLLHLLLEIRIRNPHQRQRVIPLAKAMDIRLNLPAHLILPLARDLHLHHSLRRPAHQSGIVHHARRPLHVRHDDHHPDDQPHQDHCQHRDHDVTEAVCIFLVALH